MKFCLINNLFPPLSRGGTEKIVELITAGVKNFGEVMVITSQPDDVSSCKREDNLTVCRYNPQNFYYLMDDGKKNVQEKIFWHLRDLFNRPVLKFVKEQLNKFKPDFVFTHNLKGLSLGIPKIIRKLKLTQIHTLHDYQLLEPHGSFYRQGQNLALKGPFYALYRYLTKQAIKSPDLVVSPSAFVLKKHREYGFFKKSKTAILPNPIIINHQLLATSYPLPTKLRLLYLGQIEPHKGVEFLVRTFLKWQNPNAALAIAGNGSDLEKIKKISKNDARIKILGKVENEKLAELFQNTDLLVLPSLWWENSPTVIYEAYGYGAPVLVSDTGGAKELVREGETGFIFQSGNGNDLSAKLNLIWQKKTELPGFGQNGFQLVKQFALENYLKKLLDLCSDLKK